MRAEVVALDISDARMKRLRENLARTLTREMGKPIGDAMGYDAPAAANCIAWEAFSPSTIAGWVLIGVVTPKRRAMSATVPKPTSLPSFAATVLIE